MNPSQLRRHAIVTTACLLCLLFILGLRSGLSDSETPELSKGESPPAVERTDLAEKIDQEPMEDPAVEKWLPDEEPAAANPPDSIEPEADELVGYTLEEKIRLQNVGIDQQYTGEELVRIYTVASGEEQSEGILGYLERATALRVVARIPAPLPKDKYQELRTMLRDCKKAESVEIYTDCKARYRSRFEKTLELESYMDDVEDPFTKALWRDILRFHGPFEMMAVDMGPASDLYDVAEKFRFDEPLNMADMARIQWVARLYHKYFAVIQREHIKMSLLELKLAKSIPRDWGKCDDSFGEIPRRINTHTGVYSVEDFNDKHLLEQYNAYGMQSATAQAVQKRIDALVAGEPVEEIHPRIAFSSFVLQMLHLREESPQLRGYDEFTPRVRPTTLAMDSVGAQKWLDDVYEAIDPYPMRLGNGLPKEQLQNSPQGVDNIVLDRGMFVIAQSRSDNLWRAAKVVQASRSGDVEVDYFAISGPDDEVLPRSRILMEKAAVDKLPAESFLAVEEVEKARAKEEVPEFLKNLPPGILDALDD